MVVFILTALLLPLSAKAADGFETLVTEKDGSAYEAKGALSEMPDGAESYEIKYNDKRVIRCATERALKFDRKARFCRAFFVLF